MSKRRRWGTEAAIVRQFRELREAQEKERQRKDARREARLTLKRLERPAA